MINVNGINNTDAKVNGKSLDKIYSELITAFVKYTIFDIAGHSIWTYGVFEGKRKGLKKGFGKKKEKDKDTLAAAR
jgi:hypothetical protein